MNTIWDELDHLSDDGLMLYVWSWTNTKCGMAGVYKVARRKLVEGRFDDERLTAALVELEAEGLLKYVQGVLWNCARVKRLSGISDQIAKSIAKDLAEVDGTNPIAAEFVDRYGKHPKLKGRLTLNRPSGDPQEKVDVEPDSRPSGEGHPTLPGRGRGRGSGKGSGKENNVDLESLPADADQRLATATQRCLPILQRVAEARGAKPIGLLAVYRAVESFPTKPHAQVAGEVEHWTIHGNGARKPAKDVVARFRNFLDGAADELRVAGQPGGTDRSKYNAKVREVQV